MNKLCNFLRFFLLLSITQVTFSQDPVEKEEVEEIVSEQLEEHSEEKEDEKKEKFKPYDELITKDAKSDDGLFLSHNIDDKFYFEIPDSLLNRDMLLVTRVSKLPTSSIAFHAGKKTNEMLVVWEKFRDKILLKVKSYDAIANDSLPISLSVKNNFYEPTLHAFDIESFTPDSMAYVIDVSDFYGSEVQGMSGIPSYLKKEFKVGGLDDKRSFINSIKSFPKNIEVIQDFTYRASEPPAYSNLETLSIQVNQSMVLLPEDLMQPRIFDERVGWFTVNQIDYGSNALKADEKTYIRRWRLVPKDIEAYQRGELVEPVKPIVYYIDPATPVQFRKYFREGIELWQTAFEAAGFKNAIIAKDPPTKEEDPDFNPEDVRYSVVRYIATEARNAMGPSVTDPRTGEIIESDILWYHNHLKSYRNRYLIETGAANPRARSLNTPEEDIGEMMKMVIAHEVGHTLGLPHNMAASFAYDVESYRDAEFTQKNGIATTIMDYARFNYIAQPGDDGVRFIRQLGPYDSYAINWGYRYYPEENSEQEIDQLDALVEEHTNDPWYKFGAQFDGFDPTSQTEDISNNALKASSYGIENLKIVAENLEAWTSEQTNDYRDLDELHNELLFAWSRYVRHVIGNLGGVYKNTQKPAQGDQIYTPVDKAYQKEVVQWVADHVFDTPTWLFPPELMSKISAYGSVDALSGRQEMMLRSLLSMDTLESLISHHQIDENNYSVLELFTDVQKTVWLNGNPPKKLDIYQRNLQMTYVDILEYYLDESSILDIQSIAHGQLIELEKKLRRVSRRADDDITKYHYLNLHNKVGDVLEKD